MKLDVHSLQRLLCDRLCVDVGVEERPDDTVILRTHFRFPDGDSYPIHLSATPSGALRLSDRGHTLMHISYDHDVDSFVEGSRGLLLERIMDESGLSGTEEHSASIRRLSNFHRPCLRSGKR